LAVAAVSVILAGVGITFLIAPGPKASNGEREPPPQNDPHPPEVRRPVDPSYPAARLQREVGIPLALQRDNGEPVWKKKLMGQARPSLLRGGIWAVESLAEKDARPTERMALYALDDDPEHRPYELVIEASHLVPPVRETFGMGVFFGRRDPEDRFFLVKLDFYSDPPQTVIGSALVFDANDAHAGRWDTLRGFPGMENAVRIPKTQAWHTLKLRVSGDHVTLFVDDAAPLDLDVARIRRTDPDAVIRDTLHTHGAVGIWVSNGVAMFRNARITTLQTSP
jgi:hypothetical protein